ncbi:hypothetical protein [uncultured Psychroserpens sp.]|uniref:hypothetical protein n=1 Tax=uncultured Psychroserpens sp. TaxID=255436 RepID=UPI002633FEDF|nr:hypothetical protein [uncultured Psychroserpens sp.]
MNFNLFKHFRFYHFCFFLISSSLLNLNAQNNFDEESLVDAYEDYTEAPRETIYAHLNKSTYINGEMLGFTAYAFDKFTKERSNLTSNLYCIISDLNGNVIKQKLIRVVDGVASNVFYIDEKLKSGNFMFKAYTNWMLNFEEQNHFQQVFSVLDADTQSEIASKAIDNDLDIQILGEGGHLVYNTLNTAGIIVKNKSGKGLPYAKAKIIDDNNLTINEFELNALGISKVIFNPEPNRKYFVNVYHNDAVNTIEIKDIKAIGFNMTVNNLQDRLLINFATNDASIAILKTKTFKLAIHNGNDISVVPFKMNEHAKTLTVPRSELFSGINIFTVFDEKNKPILERLVFNHININKGKTNYMSSVQDKDSLLITLKVDNNKLNQFNNVSVSILPSETKSYNHHHNLLSQLYLQPYIKTPIQNAGYYFKDKSRKTTYELDNLLLTQGWSSYNWTNIFNFSNIYKYEFEQGIRITSNINGEVKSGIYMTYPLKESTSQIYTVTENDRTILTKGLFPDSEEKFKIGYLNKKGEPRAPSVYPQFYPSTFSQFDKTYDYALFDSSRLTTSTRIPNTPSSWSDIETLDEVVITGKKEKTRIEKLQEKKIKGKIFEVTNRQRLRGTPLDVYLTSIGFVARYDLVNGIFSIINPRVNWGNPVPLVYLDDVLLWESNFDILATINLSYVDYVDVEYYGFGGGIRGQAGFIKIYTSPEFFYRNDGKANTISTFDFPLTFDEDKQFYTPKYQFYNTKFFNEYGTIDWKPNLKVDSEGLIRFKIKNSSIERINLYINGIVNGNELLSEIKTIENTNSN